MSKSKLTLRSDIPALDKALGGGFRPGTCSLIASVSQVERFTLLYQLALALAAELEHVALITTKRTPWSVVRSFVANCSRQPDKHIIDPKPAKLKLGGLDGFGQVTVLPTFPDPIDDEDEVVEGMANLEEILKYDLRFLDWSKDSSRNISSDMVAALDGIRAKQRLSDEDLYGRSSETMAEWAGREPVPVVSRWSAVVVLVDEVDQKDLEWLRAYSARTGCIAIATADSHEIDSGLSDKLGNLVSIAEGKLGELPGNYQLRVRSALGIHSCVPVDYQPEVCRFAGVAPCPAY